MVISLKTLRKLREAFMAKNSPKRGKSARNGNRPAPYTKYQKTPYRYSEKYTKWRSDRLAGRVQTRAQDWKAEDREQVRQYRMAAE